MLINGNDRVAVTDVSGYSGTCTVRLAYNSGEVQGVRNVWEQRDLAERAEKRRSDDSLAEHLETHPDVSNVPLTINYAKTDEAK